METELGLHRTLHDIQRRAEHHAVEFLDHLARAERAEVAALVFTVLGVALVSATLALGG